MSGTSALKPIDQRALEATVATFAQENLVPGAVVVLRTPQGEFTVNYGTTELGTTSPPRPDTHFRIASNSKTMTAAVIMQLAQEGKLNLSDPVSRYVAGVPNGDNITLAELLEMRSGLYNYTNAPVISETMDREPAKAWTPAELLAVAFAHPPNAPPGTEYEYNNTNFVLLGLVAEQVDGRPLAMAYQDRLFGPLGMQHTLVPASTSIAIPTPYSHGYLYGSASVAMVGTPPYSPEVQAAARAGTLRPNDFTGLNHSFAFGTGGVISTASDVAIWIQALVTGRTLNAEFQRRWLDSPRPEDPSNPGGQRYGYGIAQLRWGPNTMYFHGGETPGFNSFMGHDPASQMTLVAWTNLTVSLDEKPTANALMVRILDQIYTVSPLATPPSPTATASAERAGERSGEDFAGLVDIGGRRLYLECRGTGTPTVMLEAGGYARGDYWTRDLQEPAGRRQMVLPAVAGFTRVCAYDRPGTISEVNPALDPGGPDFLPSRSDPAPMPRNAADAVADLRALLQIAGIPSPYVLVGHSIGGIFVRLYTSAYPDEVVGLVLVDSTPEDVWQQFQARMTPAQWATFERLQFGLEPNDEYPDLERLDQQAVVAQMRQARVNTSLRPMPLFVLAHGIPFAAPFPDFPSAAMEEIMLDRERNLATLVPNARFSIASQSGHNIHQDQPALVIEAIRQVVAGVRDRDTWYDLTACCAR